MAHLPDGSLLSPIEIRIEALFGRYETLPGELPSKAEIRALLDGRFEAINIESDLQGRNFDGIAPEFLAVARRGHKGIGQATLGMVAGGPSGPSTRSQAIVRAIERGKTTILSPFTGMTEEVDSTLGREWLLHKTMDQYCLASQFGGVMVDVNLETIWVIPRSRLIFFVATALSSSDILDHIATTLLRCFQRNDRFVEYLKRPQSGASRTVALTDFPCPHMSHNLWNVQTGWANTLMHVDTAKVKKILSFSNQCFFGHLDELFPSELQSAENLEVNEVDDDDQMIDIMLRENLLLLTVKDEFFTQSFAKRIIDRAYRVCSEKFLAEVAAFKSKADLIVLTTIRLDNRAWIEQREGLAYLFLELRKDFPNLGLVVDGLSSDTVKGWTTGWMSLKDDLAIAEDVRRQLPADMPVIFAVGRLFAESIVLMNESDLFIAPSGSGMALYKWICNKPGLAFSNTAVLDENSPHRWPLRVWHDTTFRHDMVPTRHLPVRLVKDGTQARDHVSRANFHLDWRDLYNESVAFIEGVTAFRKQ